MQVPRRENLRRVELGFAFPLHALEAEQAAGVIGYQLGLREHVVVPGLEPGKLVAVALALAGHAHGKVRGRFFAGRAPDDAILPDHAVDQGKKGVRARNRDQRQQQRRNAEEIPSAMKGGRANALPVTVRAASSQAGKNRSLRGSNPQPPP